MCAACKIPTLSLFAFSLENRFRPTAEVNVLMNLVAHTLQEKLPFLQREDIRLKVIGDIYHLPNQVCKSILLAEEKTVSNRGLNLLLAINYSGQYDICQAAERWAKEPGAKSLQEYLLTAGYENPDLLIRTGGENRLSNFFLWQSAYTEIHFQPKHWPDFQIEDLEDHCAKFERTERRFGRTVVQS